MAAVIATIPVGNFPGVVAVSPDGARAYVVNSLGGTLSVIDTASNTVSGTISVSNNPRALALSPDGTLAYVTNSASNDFVAVIDTAPTPSSPPSPSAVFRTVWRSPPTAPMPTSPTAVAAPCR